MGEKEHETFVGQERLPHLYDDTNVSILLVNALQSVDKTCEPCKSCASRHLESVLAVVMVAVKERVCVARE